MRTEIDPKTTSRAFAFETWMKSPQPMVTIFKTLRIEKLIKASQCKKIKLNMLMCWCIGYAASQIPELRFLPVGKKLMQFDRFAINVIVKTKNGSICMCDVPFNENIQQFNTDYLQLTKQVQDSGKPHDLSDDCMVIGTSALTECEIDGVVNQYSGLYNNPFIAWGKYRRGWLKKRLPISLQFHHVQMDGAEACRFLNILQEEINDIKY